MMFSLLILPLLIYILLQEEGSEKDGYSSSSGMISFELSNGHPYGPHVPTTIDDDQYVEYPLDNLADFPSNVEEEEKVCLSLVDPK